MPKSGAPTGAPFFVCWRVKMAFRVILIENEVTIKVKLNNLIITKCGEEDYSPILSFEAVCAGSRDDRQCVSGMQRLRQEKRADKRAISQYADRGVHEPAL